MTSVRPLDAAAVEATVWPLTRTHVVAIAIVMSSGWVYVLVSALGWAPASWARLDQHVRDAAWVPALIALLLSAMFARWSTRDSVVFGPSAGRGYGAVMSALVRAVTLAVAAASIMAVGVITVAVKAAGADGQPLILDLASHLAGVLAAVPVGMLIARTSPARMWPLLTLAGGGLVLLAPAILTDTVLRGTGLSTMSVSLVWGMPVPDTGWTVPVTVSLLRLGYFAIVFAAATLMAGTAVRKGSRTDKARAVAPALAPAVVLVVIGMCSPQLLLAVPEHSAPACTTTPGGVQVCLGHDDRALLTDVATTVNAYTDLVSDSPYRVATAPLPSVSGDAQVIWLPEIAHAASRSDYDRQVAGNVVLALINPRNCSEVHPDEPAPAEYWRGVFSKLLMVTGVEPEANGISEDTGELSYGDGYDRLAPLSTQDFSAWLSTHIDAVRACTLSEDDLP